jgi:golgin subfamily B member 1
MTSENPEIQADQTDQEQMSADEYRQVAKVLAREGRWEDLAALLIERAETATNAVNRARHLVHAAQIFEKNLQDQDRAYITFMTAFQDDPTNEEAIAELARVSASQGKFPELLQECMGVASQVTPSEKQAAMYVVLSTWYQEQLGDPASAQHALEAALAADPTHPTALRSLVDLYRLRGDHGRAASCLASASGASRDVERKVGYALDAADMYRGLSDLDSAAEMYRRALEADPTNRPAAEALAEIGWEKKDWPTVLPLFETMALGTDVGGAQAARMFQRAGWAAQMLGDNDRARVNYRNAHGDDPTYLPALLRWASLALSEKWWDDVAIAVPAILARPDAKLTSDEQAEYWEGLGNAQLVLGKADAAADAFTRALAISPNSVACREGLAKAHGRLAGQGASGAQAMIQQQRLLLASAKSPDEQFEVLATIAKSERESLGDLHASLKTYFDMLALRPDDPVTLHEVLEIYTQAREWARAVEILERLVKVETGKPRARYLVAMGNILNYELKTTERAVEVYNLVLDEDMNDERTFGRIERILTAQSAWRELARNYRRMIKRLGNTPPPEKREQLVGIWRKLGDVCRKRLHERDAAVAAYEACAQLDPDDMRYREVLADMYEMMGAPKLNEAVKTREVLLDATSEFDDMAKHIRGLARMYGKHQMYDRLHCTSAALMAMGQAIPQEQAFYERTAAPDIVLSRIPVAEAMWQRFISSPRQEWCISHVLSVVSAGVAMARARDAVALGLNPAQKVDLANDRSSVGQMIAHACRLLSVAVPPVYVAPDAPGQLELRIVLEGQQVVPSFLLGRDLLTERSEKDLAFFLARRLVRLRADQFLLSPEAVPSLDELRVIIAAAVKVVHPEFDLPGTDPNGVRQYAAFLQKTVQPLTLASAGSAIEQIVADPSRVNLQAWAVGANQSADRAGLLFCGDAMAAVREILRSSDGQGDPEAAVKDLVRWSVSADYMDLREQLGLTAEVAPAPPEVRQPQPFPRRPYKPGA